MCLILIYALISHCACPLFQWMYGNVNSIKSTNAVHSLFNETFHIVSCIFRFVYWAGFLTAKWKIRFSGFRKLNIIRTLQLTHSQRTIVERVRDRQSKREREWVRDLMCGNTWFLFAVNIRQSAVSHSLRFEIFSLVHLTSLIFFLSSFHLPSGQYLLLFTKKLDVVVKLTHIYTFRVKWSRSSRFLCLISGKVRGWTNFLSLRIIYFRFSLPPIHSQQWADDCCCHICWYSKYWTSPQTVIRTLSSLLPCAYSSLSCSWITPLQEGWLIDKKAADDDRPKILTFTGICRYWFLIYLIASGVALLLLLFNVGFLCCWHLPHVRVFYAGFLFPYRAFLLSLN